ncbi:hypothetical protein M0802_011760 [Mischocyttarus mexicanus]|nr:hypothetical protein M0802_011760 [Mischocyttarus mexicanus]
MKKSPLNMPGGSRIHNDYQWGSYVDTRKASYLDVGYKRGYYSYNGGEMNHGDNDFIPLNNSTPNEKKHHNNNRHISKFRRNYLNSGSRFSNDNKPNIFTCTNPYLKFTPPHRHNDCVQFGRNKIIHRDGHKQMNISKYIDMESIFEDPWADLQKKLDNSSIIDGVDVSAGCSSIFFKDTSDNMSFCNTDFQNNSHNERSQSQPEDICLKISDNVSKPVIKNLFDNKFDNTKLNLTLNNVNSCNASNDNNYAANEHDKQNI